MSGYHTLLTAILERGILDVPGDFVEIGAFVGGGSYQLASLLKRRPEKLLIVIDVFDSTLDTTTCDSGLMMSDIYARWLSERVGGSQRNTFDRVTAGLDNIQVVAGNSAEVELPTDSVSFAYIDGGHTPDATSARIFSASGPSCRRED